MSEVIKIEVTAEMIKAVRDHDAAEDKRRHEKWQRTRMEAQKKWEDKLQAEALTEARKIVPSLTEKQFEDLRDDVFWDYIMELRDY